MSACGESIKSSMGRESWTDAPVTVKSSNEFVCLIYADMALIAKEILIPLLRISNSIFRFFVAQRIEFLKDKDFGHVNNIVSFSVLRLPVFIVADVVQERPKGLPVNVFGETIQAISNLVQTIHPNVGVKQPFLVQSPCKKTGQIALYFLLLCNKNTISQYKIRILFYEFAFW